MHCKIRTEKFFFGYLLELLLICWFHEFQRVELTPATVYVHGISASNNHHISKVSKPHSVASNGFQRFVTVVTVTIMSRQRK